jgi:hypothetical protein
MVAEKIHRRDAVRGFYGNPPLSTFYDRMSKGLIPRPDVALSPSTPGWTDGLIARHQQGLREAAEHGLEHRAAIGRHARRGEGKGKKHSGASATEAAT